MIRTPIVNPVRAPIKANEKRPIFSLEGVAALGFTNSYVGLGYSEVKRRWPLLTTPDANGVIKLDNIKILKGV